MDHEHFRLKLMYKQKKKVSAELKTTKSELKGLEVSKVSKVHFILFYFFFNLGQQFFSHAGTEPSLPGFNQYCRELMCLAEGHNTVTPVGIEPRTSRLGFFDMFEVICLTMGCVWLLEQNFHTYYLLPLPRTIGIKHS